MRASIISKGVLLSTFHELGICIVNYFSGGKKGKYILFDGIFFSIVLAFLAAVYSFDIRAEGGGKTPEYELLEELMSLSDRLDATTMNEHGVQIPVFQSPDEVAAVIDDLEALLAKYKTKVKIKPRQAADITLKALGVLFRGRGKIEGEGDGWYIGNRNVTQSGIAEMQYILEKGLLDTDALRQWQLDCTAGVDLDDPEVKKSVGFSPSWNISNPKLVQSIAGLGEGKAINLSGSPGAKLTLEKKYGELKIAAMVPTQALLKLNPGKLTGPELVAINKVLFNGAVRRNLYDEAVDTFTHGKKFTDYYGREKELEAITDIFTKTEKCHLMMTGKAGVGKTTILKMMVDQFVQGKDSIRDEAPPIVLELSLTTITNPNDPSVITSIYTAARRLSRATDRRVVLFVDEAHAATTMTMNALKSFLTDLVRPATGSDRVHVAFLSTSGESRRFLEDSAFSRRFSYLNVPEFDRDATIKLIKQSHLSRWTEDFVKKDYRLKGISEDAYDFAFRYGEMENIHSGNPTPTKELLEATIAQMMNQGVREKKKGDFEVTVDDVRQYLQSKGVRLFPGDPDFEKKFELLWKQFEAQYVGGQGLKTDLKPWLKSHFMNLHKSLMTAGAFFGPPGAGKTYLADSVAEVFYGNKNAVCLIEGGLYADGGLKLNTLIGSPTGTVGSEEQRSKLTKFIMDNPHGGVILVDEADYMHTDIIRFFTNMVSAKKFEDGLGKDWDTSRYLIMFTSNIGQERMIPPDSRHKMTWEQYDSRRKAMTEVITVGDQHGVQRVRSDVLDGIFDHFVETIVTKSNPTGDTSDVSKEAQKQKRRYKAFYVMGPDRQDLLLAAKNKVKKFIENARVDYGIEFTIPDSVVEELLRVESYDFSLGYSYVDQQLTEKLFRQLESHYGERGAKYSVSTREIEVPFGPNGETLPATVLVLSQGKGKPVFEHSLSIVSKTAGNPWGDSAEMMGRINHLATNMRTSIKGMSEPIHEAKKLALLKAADWDTRMVFTHLGSSGTGKTEFFKALALHLYGDEKAIFKIEGVTHPWDLDKHFRPDSPSLVGANKETEFEKWVKSRIHSGGGVILFDELLSFNDRPSDQVMTYGGVKGGKIEALQRIYELLDTGFLSIGGRNFDLRGFSIGITGNALQENFRGIPDDPAAEAVVKKILKKLSQAEIVKQLIGKGLDAPKIARLGHISVNGPLPRRDTLEVGKMLLDRAVSTVKAKFRRPLEVTVDPKILDSVVHELTTLELGMRSVKRGFEKVVEGPVAGIFMNVPSVKKIEARMDGEGKIQWYADQKRVILVGTSVDDSLTEENWTLAKPTGETKDRTPQIADLPKPDRLQFSESALKATAAHELYGHWMAGVLLNRENLSEAISLYAGENYLGYVSFKEEGKYQERDLSYLLRDIVILAAGHRANFLAGQMSTGGGNSGVPRDPKGWPSDDLGKVDRGIGGMINNELLPGITEQSKKGDIQAVKILVKKLAIRMADRIITEGIASGKFRELAKTLLEKRFLGSDELDAFVKELDFKPFGGKEEFFLKHLAEAAREGLSKKFSASTRTKSDKLLLGIVARAFLEADSRNAGNRAEMVSIREVKRAFLDKIKIDETVLFEVAAVNPCQTGYAELF